MNINAPKILTEWVLNNKILSSMTAELSLKYFTNKSKKATITIESDKLLFSITLWDTGMLSLILVNAISCEDIKSADIECLSKKDIIISLNKFLS
jgi:hypothetical protein